MGVTAAITEMLVQSHENVIDLLPALPDEWQSGKFNGVCARGAFELSFEWEKAKIRRVEVISKEGQICRIDAGLITSVTCDGKKIKFRKLKDGEIEFPTQKGSHYLLI
jgi:alpha-L-fucosidase 2